MSVIAALAKYGNVQPDVAAQMDYLEARELARRVVDLHESERESVQKLHLELTKAIIKSNGARVS